jgi:uncharacterized protein
MARKIFVNLSVTDLPATMAFWRALGFDFNLQYTDETAACLVISDDIFAMLLTRPKFAEFSHKALVDSHKSAEVLIALSVETRADVDRIVEGAAAHGGKLHGEAKDHGFMYYRAMEDQDGHIWEITYFPEQPA